MANCLTHCTRNGAMPINYNCIYNRVKYTLHPPALLKFQLCIFSNKLKFIKLHVHILNRTNSKNLVTTTLTLSRSVDALCCDIKVWPKMTIMTSYFS